MTKYVLLKCYETKLFKTLVIIKLNYCTILDVNKFKKENNEDGPEDKSGICTGKFNFVMLLS